MANVSVSGLTKQFGATRVIDQLDLEVGEGEFVTLLGPSGCGKTTTLRCIAGLETPDAGTLRIGGNIMFASDTRVAIAPEQRHIGMVFQSYALWPHMSVFGNVAYPLKMQRTPRTEIRKRVVETLTLVGLEHLATRPATALSGGQQQRVALARAMVARPRLMLYDEPLSNLDAKLRNQMRNLLRRLRRVMPTTSIYVTHDQLEAITLSDRIVVMRGGQIEQVGTPHEIYAQPANPFVADFIGFENVWCANVVDSGPGGCRVRLSDQGTLLELDQTKEALGGTDEVWLAIRADKIELHTQCPTDGSGAFEAQVGYVAYLGDQLEYGVRIGDRRFTARTTAPPLGTAVPEAGTRIWVRFPEENIVALAPQRQDLEGNDDLSKERKNDESKLPATR